MAEARASGGLEQDARPLEIWAWAMYDFANSGYTTVVLTAIFNAYFVAVVAGNAPWATFAWTATLSLSYALVIVTTPGNRRLRRSARQPEAAAAFHHRRLCARYCGPRLGRPR